MSARPRRWWLDRAQRHRGAQAHELGERIEREEAGHAASRPPRPDPDPDQLAWFLLRLALEDPDQRARRVEADGCSTEWLDNLARALRRRRTAGGCPRPRRPPDRLRRYT